MEIRDLHYNIKTGAYQASVCLHHAGRLVTLPTTVRSHKALAPALLSDIIAHRALVQLEPERPIR